MEGAGLYLAAVFSSSQLALLLKGEGSTPVIDGCFASDIL